MTRFSQLYIERGKATSDLSKRVRNRLMGFIEDMDPDDIPPIVNQIKRDIGSEIPPMGNLEADCYVVAPNRRKQRRAGRSNRSVSGSVETDGLFGAAAG